RRARRQAAGGRQQKAGSRRQAAEGRQQKAGSRRQAAEGRQQFLLSAICYLLSAICYLLSAICYLLSAICYLLSAICSLPPLARPPSPRCNSVHRPEHSREVALVGEAVVECDLRQRGGRAKQSVRCAANAELTQVRTGRRAIVRAECAREVRRVHAGQFGELREP